MSEDVLDRSDCPYATAPSEAGEGHVVELSRLVVSSTEPSDQEPAYTEHVAHAFPSSTCRSRWCPIVSRSTMIGSFIGVSLFVFFVTMTIMGGEERGSSLIIQPNDLYAMHDILLAGYAGVFMKNDTLGKALVQASAWNLTSHLNTLHPYEPCRTRLLALPPQSTQIRTVAAAANVLWECLPYHFSTQAFVGGVAFNASTVSNRNLQDAARNPQLKAIPCHALGSCMDSGWTRTCSYWAAIHAMALRSEVPDVSDTTSVLSDSSDSTDKATFLRSLLVTIAGGITQCRG